MRYLLTKSFYETGIKNAAFEHIENVLTIVSSTGLMTSLLTIEPGNNTIKKAIYGLASYNFGIFLIHRVVYTKINSLGVRAKIYRISESGSVGKILATLAYIFIIYIMSLIAAAIIRFVWTAVKKGMRKICYAAKSKRE